MTTMLIEISLAVAIVFLLGCVPALWRAYRRERRIRRIAKALGAVPSSDKACWKVTRL